MNEHDTLASSLLTPHYNMHNTQYTVYLFDLTYRSYMYLYVLNYINSSSMSIGTIYYQYVVFTFGVFPLITWCTYILYIYIYIYISISMWSPSNARNDKAESALLQMPQALEQKCFNRLLNKGVMAWQKYSILFPMEHNPL